MDSRCEGEGINIFRRTQNTRCCALPNVRANFIAARREQARARPATDVHDLLVRGHLRHLHRVDRAHSMHRPSLARRSLQRRVQFVREQGRVEWQDGERALLRSYSSSRVRARERAEPGLREELLQRRDPR